MKSVINRIAKIAVVMIGTALGCTSVLSHIMSESIYQSTLTMWEYLDIVRDIESIHGIMCIEFGCLLVCVGFAFITSPIIQKQES